MDNYSNEFSIEWETLKNNFISEMKEKPLPYITEKTVNEWFRTASFRFESSIETEGMVLEQLKKPDFRKALLSKISEFKFTGETYISKPSITKSLIAGIVFGGIVGVGAWFLLPAFKWIAIVLGVACFAVPIIKYYNDIPQYEEKAKAELIKKYSNQLEEYKRELLLICKLHNL